MELSKFNWNEHQGNVSTHEVPKQEHNNIDMDKAFNDFMDSVGQYTNDERVMSTRGEQRDNALQTAHLALQILEHGKSYVEYAKAVRNRIEDLCVQIGTSTLPKDKKMELVSKLRKYQEE